MRSPSAPATWPAWGPMMSKTASSSSSADVISSSMLVAGRCDADASLFRNPIRQFARDVDQELVHRPRAHRLRLDHVELEGKKAAAMWSFSQSLMLFQNRVAWLK